MMKKTVLFMLSLILLVIPVTMASAQGPRDGDRPIGQARDGRLPGDIIDILTDVTGLSAREFVAELRDGGTIAEVLEANGADVTEVTNEVIAALLARLDEAEEEGRIDAERAAELRESIPERVETAINETPRRPMPPMRRNEDRIFGVLAETITGATGLDVREITEQVRDGATLAEILEANGTDSAAITAEVMAQLETRLQDAVTAGDLTEEEVAEMLENAETRLMEWLNNETPFPQMIRDRIQERIEEIVPDVFRELSETITEQTGLTPREIAAQVRDGATLRDVIVENGGDVDAITETALSLLDARLEEAVANGDLSEERAATLRENAGERIDAWLSGEAPLPRPGRR